MQPNSWRTKAYELDRYRWSLLRERFGRFGAAIRFLRDGLGDALFGGLARFRLAKDGGGSVGCDFLLLQSAPKVIPLQRKKLLKERLRSRGSSLEETALLEPRQILAERRLRRPPESVPLRYYGYAAYAEWLVSHYMPSILLNDRNGSLYSPFLRLSLNARRLLLVHLAHATTVERSRRLGMSDYDYYFLFGQSSLDALSGRQLRFGSAKVVLAGSHMIDQSYAVPPAQVDNRVLLVLGVGPDKEKEAGYQRSYELIRDWAVAHPYYQVLVKAHPRSKVVFWQDASAQAKNIQVLPATCGLAEAMSRAGIVINIMSNAVIEAALARRPIIYVNQGPDRDIFDQERFFGRRVDSLEELTDRVHQIYADHQRSLESASQFASFHLVHGVQGLERNIDYLCALLRREEIPHQVLEGTCR
ncbi:capsule biosynthesis protein [Pseudomonas zhanjiangensis]|uniref:Capsule biosynthesis protein n=1 Tax=Pseudomonas zhanjiangensis TaxID=3239015 RepID=A0ABV3YQ51_9PSED